jgi:acyl carrier protein
MSVRATVIQIFQQIASEQHRTLSHISDDMKLLESGLDSLGFALIVARLDEVLGVDPFEDIAHFPVTFGDFVKLYENHQK